MHRGINALQARLDYAWRVASTGLCFVIFGALCVGVSLVWFPLLSLVSHDAATVRRRIRRSIRFLYGGYLRMMRALGVISYEMHGSERLQASGQLVVANHPSLIDVLLIGAHIPRVDCIVKEALLRNPFLGVPVRWAGYIPNSTPERLIEDCLQTLQLGHSLLIFPEGTRSVPGQPLRLARGAAHIALAAGCDLLPVSIRCVPNALSKSDVWYRVPARRPHWTIVVGEPIRLAPLVLPGESRSRSARRITDHLTRYFMAAIGTPAPTPGPVMPQPAHSPAPIAQHPVL